MPAQLKLTNVVVLGAWNSSIITPEWLAQYKVIDQAPANVQFELGVPVNRVTFQTQDVTWSVDANRLEVKASQLLDCGTYIARILELLPHTPVAAIGSNFVFACPFPEWPKNKLPKFDSIELGNSESDPQLHQVQWAGVWKLDDATRMQVTVTQLEVTEITVAVNFHRNVPSTEKALAYASAWAHDRAHAFGLIQTRFGVNL